MRSTRTRWLTVGVSTLAVLLASSACSSSNGASVSSQSNTSGTTSSSAPIAGVLTMQQLYAGTYSKPPSTSPPGAKGKKVWWISCSQAVVSCSGAANAAAEAAKVLGIDFHIADGKFNVGGAFTTAVRTALADKPDAILLYGVACEPTLGALQDAKAAGVKLMGIETPDCSDNGGPKMFDVTENYSDNYKTTPDLWKAYGAFNADYIINKSGGHAKIIQNAGGVEPLQKFEAEGFTTELKKCTGCTVVATVPYDSSKLTPNGPWIQAFRTSLVQHPEATAVYFPFDLMMTILGGAQAVQDTGRQLITFGGQAADDGLDALRQGKVTALSSARASFWSAYAAIDSVNRALQKTPLPSEGIGFQTVDKDHNLPASGSYVPPIDYKAAYLKVWNNGAGTP